MLAITDTRMRDDMICSLQGKGFNILKMPPATYLSAPVASHADMLIFMGYGRLVCHRRYYAENKDIIDLIARASSLEVMLSDENTDGKYPHDVLFNCLTLKDQGVLLCNKKTVSRLILDLAAEHGATVLHTNQGYTKCSVCNVSEDAIITSDVSIHGICTQNGIHSLLVSPDGVALAGMSCGFIGGASGSDGRYTYFCGDITSHPDGQNIKNFCNEYQKPAVSLANTPLYDLGTVFFV